MAMTSCPQCNGYMSSYALSCPHCEKMNPAAPQAILLQEKRKGFSSLSSRVPEPYLAVAHEETFDVDRDARGHKFLGVQWIEELCDEWSALQPSKQRVLKILFGFALVAGVILFVYALLF